MNDDPAAGMRRMERRLYPDAIRSDPAEWVIAAGGTWNEPYTLWWCPQDGRILLIAVRGNVGLYEEPVALSPPAAERISAALRHGDRATAAALSESATAG